MIKKIKKKMKKSNQGNTFILVIATVSFLAVLTSALLVAVGLCYKLKAYDINSRDNFYYLEKAMDDIYQTVGGMSMKHLSDAYNEVADVIVYYDVDKKSYVTMSNDDANKLMCKSFMDKLLSDKNLARRDPDLTDSVVADQNKCMTKTIKDAMAESISQGVSLESIGNITHTDSTLTVHDVTLKRKSMYSTMNTYKDASDPDKLAAPAEFVQWITTDIEISAPAFKVDFNSMDNDDVYDFSLISDMGVEIEGVDNKTNINGNIYAASDFYNKDYNDEADTNVSQYADGDAHLDIYNGLTERSMYSGFYVSKAKVAVMADKMIVPGSVSAMNCAELSIFGSGKESVNNTDTSLDEKAKVTDKYTQLWADNIVLGGYAKRTSALNTSALKGSEVKLRANAFVYDDTEINATSSALTLNGNYYGYSNGTDDKRSFSKAYVEAVTKKSISKHKDIKIEDGNYKAADGSVLNLPGQSHYNSSSIVVNGVNSKIDLKNADSMYLAGQAYVEMSKETKAEAFSVRKNDDTVEVALSDPTADTDPYSYETQSDDNYSLVKDGADYVKERIQDYKTGESLSVKSNQLAYIPPYHVHDVEGEPITTVWPAFLSNPTDATYNDYISNLPTEKQDVLAYLRAIPGKFPNKQIPVVKTVASGKTYYFYDFSGTDIQPDEFIRKYAEAFEIISVMVDGEARNLQSIGDMADFYDITNWEQFKINCVLINEDNIYSNAAISVKDTADDATLKVIGDKKMIEPLVKADSEFKLGQGIVDTMDSTVASVNTTNGFRSKYKYLKLFLTEKPNSKALADNDVTTAKDTAITPINTYFNFDKVNDSVTTLPTGYTVFQSTGDIEISGGEKVKGLVFCKGNVTFDSDVKEFQGLIVCGGKIQVNHSMNFIANREVVKSIISDCKDGAIHHNSSYEQIYNLFKVNPAIKDEDKKVASDSVSMKTVDSVQFEDILGYKNWTKNVVEE